MLPTNDWSKDQNSLLAFLHESPKLVPSLKASYMRGRWLLRCDEHHVSQTVAVESSNRCKVLRQCFAATLVERRNELLDCLICSFFDCFWIHFFVLSVS